MNDNVLRDVVRRTNGELYIGIVGAVRSGKSMFIRKFMQNKVIPYLLTEEEKQKVIDELPQSSEGKAIMTVEPKFVPSTAANVVINNELNLSIRLVDCVGYVIPTANGYSNEDGSPRLVKTPWFNENVPFEEAAKVGTNKVITNHAHIGIVMTSDGSFGEFKRDEYEECEKKVIEELKSINKPFIVILNTTMPGSNETNELVEKMTIEYETSVIAIDVNNMTDSDITNVLKLTLSEFDISQLDLNIPSWIEVLDETNEYKQRISTYIDDATINYHKFKDVEKIRERLSECDLFNSVVISSLDSGTGEVSIDISVDDSLYNDLLVNIVGEDVLSDKTKFLSFIQESQLLKVNFNDYKVAIESVKGTGYGISVPKIEDMILDTPEVVKIGNRYGIKLRAVAPSIHMIKVDVESVFEPIIGSLEQSKQIIDKLSKDFESNPEGIWNTELFGRKLSEVVNDGIRAKIYLLPEDAQYKFRESLEKVVNKGKGGILAIVL